MMPHRISKDEGPLSEFSTQRALNHVEAISKQPHYVGSKNHEEVADYLVVELKELGLEVHLQEGTTLSDWGNLVKSKNITARIRGSANTKALLLLSHYDSAPHSYAHGAADDASGLGVILEGIRAFLHNKTPHKNDIIILFSDAEELGLNGAALFVTQNAWAKEIGLALNFEARGTAGPSYMLMEVNNGNSAIVQGFAAANVQYPVSNSLMYSIYKMLPNDTDLTVFREQGKVQGLNFAFIDDHFNYHTKQDDLAHLSLKSVAHQGSYLMPLLTHFSNSDLTTLQSADDDVYFNAPFVFVHYPFSWNIPLVAIAFLLFVFLVFVGMGKRLLVPREIANGFGTLFTALLVSGALAFLGWKLLLVLYPQYNDILQGFPYNGHYYIATFIFLTLGFLFFFYRRSNTYVLNLNHVVAPMFLWLIINTAIVFLLPGAGFMVVPVYFSLVVFGFLIGTQKNNMVFNMIMSVPALVIIAPFIAMFPIGLGLKVLVGSAILTVLLFGLLLPVFGSMGRKPLWSGLFFVLAFGSFGYAHFDSGFEASKARPNSLVYIYDADLDKAVWATYDKRLDDWTQTYLTDKPQPATHLEPLQLFSKYNSKFTFTSEALVRDLAEPKVEFLLDSVIKSQRHVRIRITPGRNVNRYDIFANENLEIHNFKANGAKALGQKGSLYERKTRKVLSYYVVDNEPLEMQFSVSAKSELDMELMESSFDLMSNPAFEIKKRSSSMMPTPFVLTDAIAIRKKIRKQSAVPVPVQKNFTLVRSSVTDTIPDMDANPETE
jgi:hypothetical protein